MDLEFPETIFGVDCDSDDGIFENDQEVPPHRWLKCAIEFVWLHKLPTTIKEIEEVEEMGHVGGLPVIEEVDEEDDVEILAQIPEVVVEHAPTPPLDAGQEIIIDKSLNRVKEVTEDLVDLLTSLKVSFPESPNSFCTTFSMSGSDNQHGTRPEPGGTMSKSSSLDLIRNRLSREIVPETSQRLQPGASSSSKNNVGTVPDDSSIICTTGCRCSFHVSRPPSRRLSLPELESPDWH
ncbi:hypothetical protein AN958_00576 [Leucoagaricus sp. SymC.cos]|nr:hypothetical protein AN958_00576 [Leucoagaricus sp. SymC.cos]